MTMTPAQQIVRLEYVVREQIKEIDRLRTENQALVDWIRGDSSHMLTGDPQQLDRIRDQ